MRALILALLIVVAPAALAQDRPCGSSLAQDRPCGSSLAARDRSPQPDTVTLRDYLTTSLDQFRSELLNRIEQLDKAQQKLLDERDRQYSQRFEAQQGALAFALQAAKEAVINALIAAKEAVTKAEEGSNKRFAAMEDKITSLGSRMDRITGTGEGYSTFWTVGAAVFVILIALAGVAINFTRKPSRP